ncbi:MAG: ATP-binding protein, partial [Rubrivivax sp.]|nr:ATP-binding protein [Rubrivivax sp.]
VDVFGSAGKHLGQLIEDLLDFSRVEAGGVQLAIQPFEPRALASELEALFTSRAQSQSLRFSVTCASDLPQWLLGDAHRLRQVLVNLLGNAVKFTREGEVALSLRCDADALVIEVSDTGIGVPADKLGAIFEPFVQADTGVAREFGGSGLGLAITRRLVQVMDGTIAIDSEPGRGTVISLRLPLAACDAPAPALTPLDTGSAAPRWPGRRVLLAEDHPHNVLVVQGMLAGSGLVIEIAADGRSAVRMAAETAYDLVLMDVQMPLLDGHAATREIRRAERDAGRPPAPILALSANALAGDVQASLQAGCDGHLAKPLMKATLLAALQAHLPAHLPAHFPATDPAPSPQPLPTALLPLPLPLMDADAALQRLGGNQALFAKVCASALVQFRVWDDSFDAAVAAGDLATARRLAHDLKSITGTLGAAPLEALAALLEQQCLSADGPAASLRQAVRAALADLCQRLEASAS